MARQNLHALKATLGWRTLEAGRTHPREHAHARGLRATGTFAGWTSASSTSSTARLRLRNFSSVFVAADSGPARFDDREVGNGVGARTRRLHRRQAGARHRPARDLRTPTLANQTQLVAGGGYVTQPAGDAARSTPRASWTSSCCRRSRGRRASTATRARRSTPPPIRITSASCAANSISATLRASYTFTPQLTLQAYAQAFLASGHFDDIKPIMRNGVPDGIVGLADLAAAPSINPINSPGFVDPDFEDAALNVNVVFRWEYRLGSTIYFVYARSQIPTVTNFTPPG